MRWYWGADTVYRIHSPFVFEFIQEVLEADREYYCFERLREIRNALLQDHSSIDVTDFGAGSRKLGNRRKISDIVQNSELSIEDGEFLFRLLQWIKPAHMLELGTSVGLGSLYHHEARRSAAFTTIEGCPQTAAAAQQLFHKFASPDLTLLCGQFEDVLPALLPTLPRLDYVLFDGNHRYDPTLLYFRQCLPLAHEQTVFVFDDIHWTADMERAWEEIKKAPEVTLTIDTFHYGLVFFHKHSAQKQHFKIAPRRWKPWQTGLLVSRSGK